ncbi:jg9088 [Pararge aegeria aegeria]|uniref:Jg9088 protein n=1 Tax=Pararge aegeria aegeria TaxID=348720 RepID=A0A8S4RU17_9NEOP|nr:jg9088 [Pararge aegeria aegeria]
MSVEPLVFMPVDSWVELKSVLKSDWPRSILGVLVLENQESLLKSGVVYDFKVYCPFGDVNNGMVALNIKGTYYDVIIQCPKDDTRVLEEALKSTNIVDWKKCEQIPALPKHILDCVRRLYSAKNLKIDPIENISRADTFVLDKGALPFDVRLPLGHSFKLLSLDS